MNSYLPVIKKALDWVNTQMLTFDSGYYGVYERIRIDLHQRTSWSRPDCTAGHLRALHTYTGITGKDEFAGIKENLLAWLERTQEQEPHSVWKGSLPFYLVDGHIREGKVDASIYQNDNGKIILAMAQLYRSEKDERMLKIAKGIADYWINAQQPDGTFGIIDGRNMQECAKGPCFVQWLAAGLYELSEITGDKHYLNSAEKGMVYLIPLIKDNGRCLTTNELIQMEDWRPVSSETAIMLHLLGIAYRITKNPLYLQKLNLVGGYLLRLQHESGAIRNCEPECLNASLQNNPDICDLVYTQGFALQALVGAYSITGENAYLNAAFALGNFLAGIQCSGESPLWDGGWRGSYNVITRQWDGRADQNNLIDEGGMFSVYTGWCCAEIAYGLELLEQHRK